MNDNTFLVIEQAYALLDQHAADDFVSKKDARDCARALRLAYEGELKAEKDQPYKTILSMILAEVSKAKAKHPNNDKELTDWALIVGEESGEMIRAVLQHKFEGGTISEVIKETVQTAATAIRLLSFLETPKENALNLSNYSKGYKINVKAPERDQQRGNPLTSPGVLYYRYDLSNDFTEVGRPGRDGEVNFQFFETTRVGTLHGGKYQFIDGDDTYTFWGYEIEGGGLGNG